MRERVKIKHQFFLLFIFFTYIAFDSFSQFYVGGKLCASAANNCPEPTIFFDEDRTATAWQWNFGDLGSATNTANIRNPKHTYTSAGNYTVTLIRTIGTVVQPPVTRTITIGSPPTQAKFFGKTNQDMTICGGKTLTLNPYEGTPAPSGVSYLWFPKGEITPTLAVNKSGCYSVEVFSPNGCSTTAQINVKVCLENSSGGGSEKWYFGSGATLEFNKTTSPPPPKNPFDATGNLFATNPTDPTFLPITPTKSNPLDSPSGAAMVYDPKGDLLYYTDGIKVYDKDDAPLAFMPPLTNGDLGGTNTSTQSVIIVPKNTCYECPHHLYYVYTTNQTTGMLAYSIIDTRRNGGKGAIVEKDVPVFLATTERLAATVIQDDKAKGVYVYSHDAGTNTFRILKIDSTGTTETLQNIGLVHDDASSKVGYMRLSPTNAKMAVAVSKGGKNYVEVFDIDKATGKLLPPITIDLGIAAPPHIYGLEFSEDEQKLYITLRGDPSLIGAGKTSFLYQLNLNLRNPVAIAANIILIDRSNTVAFGALQMGPRSGGTGGKFIYMAINGSSNLSYITNPGTLGLPTNTMITNAGLVGYELFSSPSNDANVLGTSGYGLPNIIQAKPQQEGESVSATYEGNCQNRPTKFTTQGVCSPMTAKATWDFGDGTTGAGLTTTHTYTKTGTYKVKLTVTILEDNLVSKSVSIPILGNALKDKCMEVTVEDEIYIKPTPELNLPDDAYVCVAKGKSLVLDPKADNLFSPTYLWTPNSETTPNITVSALGNYEVKVTNKFPNTTVCVNTDKITILDGCEPEVYVPEIFTPNKDGINDVFEVPHAYITNYNLQIYNRWGEIIYETNNPNDKWDGTYQGKKVLPSTYAYVLSYKSSDFPNREKITRRGAIVLVN